VLSLTAGFMIYKAGEWMFNFAVYISTDLDVDDKKVNKQLDIFRVQRILLDKSRNLLKGNI